MLGWLFLGLAFAGSAAAIPLLFLDWFEPRGNFQVLFADVEGIMFYPSAFDTSTAGAVIAVLLALTTMGAVLAVAQGVFVAWIVGVTAAITGAVVSLILRESPPAPGANVFTPPELALQPTAAPLIAMGCFLLATVSMMVWALGARQRRSA